MSLHFTMTLNRPTCFALAAAVFVTVLSGCTVGPDYRGAPAVAQNDLQSKTFLRTPNTGMTTASAPNQWWLALNDPQLNELIATALAHSPDVHIAQARLRESRAQLDQQNANALPKISGNAAALRTREPDFNALNWAGSSGNSGSSGRGPLQFYTAGFDASWEIDLFGGTRRAIEAASANAQAVDADLADTQVSLAAEVARTYVELRDQQTRLELAQRQAQTEQKILTLTEERRQRGTAADVDVERLSTQVENTRATLTPLDAQVTDSLDRLAVLTGNAPGTLDSQLAATRPLPALPQTVAIGDPSALLQQRPDIRAAERRLASSNAQIGEHIADFFPKVTLLGDIGFSASDPGHLIRKSNFSWIAAPYLQWNALDFGRTLGSVHAAEASRDEAQAQYTKAVLEALQDANSSLSRYGHQREHVVTLQKVEASATHSATLMRQRYSAGVATLIDLLDTQRQEFTAQQNVVAGQAELLEDFIALQKSLGLGWQG
jgi:NodT family efflux transporter outer membrane factor (OMF) lipoprotein